MLSIALLNCTDSVTVSFFIAGYLGTSDCQVVHRKRMAKICKKFPHVSQNNNYCHNVQK